MSLRTTELYDRFRTKIKQYFSSREISQSVDVGLAGLLGADFGSADGKIIGEIKRKEELTNNCMASSWTHWRNCKGRIQLKYVSKMAKKFEDSSCFTKFIFATICGQLATYVFRAFLCEGWLVLEASDTFRREDLEDAIRRINSLGCFRRRPEVQLCDHLYYIRVSFDVNLKSWFRI